MENKSNSLNRIKRQQREKVLRFSIRKYSFGAASVAVAALMFLGARVASADSLVDKTSQLNTGVVNPKDKVDSPVDVAASTDNKVDAENQALTNAAPSASTVDKAKLKKVVEELNALLSTKLNLDESVVSPVKDRLQKGKEALEGSELAQKDIDELVELLSKDVTVVSAAKEVTEVQVDKKVDKQADKTEKPADNLASQTSPQVSASEESQTVSAKKDALKVSVDQLKAAVLEVPEHETSKEVLEKANELLGLAQGVLENTTVSLNDVEDMTKRVKRMFNSVKNATTRLTSGARDPRNGKSMGQGTGGRAATVSSQWTKQDNLLIYQRFRATDFYGNIRNNDRQFTENKVDMTARTQMIDGQKYLVYDVFFNNDGRSMVGLSRQQLYNVILPPKILDLQSNGYYKDDAIRDLYFETYRRNNQNEGGTLSQNPDKFRYESTQDFHFKNDTSTSKGSLTFLNTLGVRDGSSHDQDMKGYFKNNKNDPFLNKATALDGVNRGKSYGIGVRTNDATAAVHMHFKAKLRPGVTDEDVQKAFTLAVAGTYGPTTNQSYTFVSGKESTENVEPTVKQSSQYPIIGKEVTKKVGESLGNLNNPVESGFVTRNDGSKNFPNNMSWSWPDGQPNTGTAGVFQRQVKATYNSDNTSNTTTATLKVIPNQPTIDQNSVNEKAGKTGQTVTVNVGNGVPNNSKVNIYDGDRIIGTGTTNGQTATVTVKEPLPGKPLKAETVVTNSNGTVTSDKSNPVTPTEAPDNQPPTLTISPASQDVVEGKQVTFTVTARDDKHVNFDPSDLTTKYSSRLITGNVSATPLTNTDTEQSRRITITTTAEDVGKTNTITFKATDNAGHAAKPVTFTFTVTSRDKIAPTITAADATVTKNEPITPIPVTAVDNPGGVGMRDNNPIEVSNLPQGLKYENGKITGTTNAKTGFYTVKIKAYDKNNNSSEKTIRITVQEQASKYNPTGDTLTVNQGQPITDEAVKAKVTNYGPGTLTVQSKPTSTATAGNAGNAVVKVTYPDGSSDTVDVPVTVKDVTGPTITANDTTVTKNEPITPIPVTAVDNTGGVGMRDNNPIQVSNLPQGLKYENGQITGTTNAKTGFYTVRITAYDKNNTPSTKAIRITVQEQASKYNPTGDTLTVNQGQPITDEAVKAKVTNYGPGTLTVESKPTSTATAGNAGNAVVKVTYSDGSSDRVNVPVTVKDVTGPTITAESATVTKNTPITPIPVTAVDNTGGVGMRDNNPIQVSNLPQGLKYENGQITGTTNAKTGFYTVKITAYDKNNTPSTKSIRITVQDQLAGTATGKTVPEKTPVPANTKVVTPNRPGTTITTDKPVNGLTVDNGGNLVGTPTVDNWEPKEEERTVEIPVKLKNGPEEAVVKVPVKIQRDTDGDGIPDVTDPDDDNDGIPDTEDATPKVADKLTGTVTGKTVPEKTPVPANTKVVTPNKPGTTITTDKPVNGLTVDNGGNLVGTPTVDNWEPKEEERTVEIPVKLKKGTEEVVVKVPVKIQRDTDGDGIPDVTDPDDDNDGIPDTEDANPKVADKLTGTVTGKTVPEKTPVPANTKVITPNKPGTTITTDKPVNGLTVDNGGNLVGTPTVDNWEPKEEERTVEIPVKLKKGTEEVVVKVPVKIQRDTDGDGIPDVTDPDDDNDGIPDTEDANPKVADKLTGTVTGKTVPEKTPVPANTKVITPNKPGTTITTDKPVNGLTVDNGGNLVGTPTVDNWEPKEEERTVEIPVKLKKGTEEVVVKVPVKIQRDTDGDGIPDVTDPDDDNDGIPDEEEITNGTDPKTPTTQTPTIEITQQPNGNAIVTPKKPDGKPYPPGTKVEIPGKDKDHPITVTIGDNGSGEVPNDKLPKKAVPGKGTVTEPNKNPSKPVDVTTPAHKTPKLELDQDPETGDVTVTPKKPDGSPFPSGTKVEIPGENGPITVTIGEDGKGKVPNSELPDGKVPGTGKITEPGKPTEEVPVETPSKIIPGAPTTEQPVEIEINQKPNGDAVVTPKKEDGKPYPSGTKVEIPGEDKDGNPITITVTIGDNGSGEVPNDKLPKKDIPGKGKVTEPNKKPSQPVDVTTPARKTPTLDVEQDPKTGDVTVTPKKPDGSPFPSGTKVEIPGKDKDHPITVTIGEDGKGKVPNSELPEGKVPGTGKVTEPGKPTEEVPVETPARKTPTLDVEQDPKTGDVTVTPKRPDGSTFPSGTKVEIPGKDKDHPITVTIGEDGKGKVPNSELPEGKVPGTGKITEPGRPTEEVPVETPAHKTPTLDVEQDPKTGDVTVTPKRPDGSTFPPGTKVEIPGKDKDHPITVTIGEDGKGKVPNSELPEGKVPGTGKITEPGRPTEEVPVETPAHKTPTLDVEQDPKTGDVTVTPKRPDGSTFPPGTKVEIPGKDKDHPITVTIGEDGKGKVPNSELPEGKVPGTGKITEPGRPTEEVPVETPAHKTPTLDVEQDPKTGDVTVTPKRPDGSTFPPGTKVEIPGKDKDHPITVTIGEDGKGKVPNSELPEGKVPGTGKITEPGRPTEEVPVETPAHKTPTLDVEQDPKTGDVTVTPKRPDGSTFPPGTKVEIPGKDKDHPITVTIGEDGKGKVPNSELPEGKVPGTAKITEPGQPTVEVPVETPAKVTPETPTTEKPGEIEITQQPNGNAIVTPKKPDGSTYPPGTKVEIPGENGTTITVTIGDNGSGEVPNDNLPKQDVPGTGTVTEPNKKPSQPVDVTTPARKTPTVELEQDPKTGDVTVTPKKPDGSTYPPGTKVEIPGKDGNPITVTIGEDGKGKVPNSELPEGKVPGTAKITEPGQPTVEVPVETPAKVTPETPTTEKPGEIEITQQPNGNAIVTPKKPDGSTYPPGTKVEIPGENGTTITVTIGDNGSGEVPNDNLPKQDVPGTGTVTEPNKKPSQPVDVTTPARKTPTVELEQDPKTGDVTVTPKKPDGSTYPPGTKVEIPGKDGNPITVTIGEDGKGKVPNSELPEGKVPGTAKITEPGQPTVEVPVETPAKVTPETPTTEKPGEIEITQQPNGNAIVTPKKPDGSTYPPGTKVEIPGENGTTITVTIGDNGSGEVPNDNLPKQDVPGTGTVTEPNKKPSQPVDVTTPARKTPTVELEQDPKTGDVTVTPKKPDGSTYPPGTKVEIPGKDGNPITVTIGEDGKGKVPNSELPEGKVPGTAKITEPGQPTVEVPVETPAKVTPETPTTEKPGEIEITQQPNGNAIVTPKKPDGSTYPPGTKVEIPGENGTTITVTIGDNGSGEVPNDNLPKQDVPGTGTVTEPNKKPSQPVDVTTPARKTPTVELEQDPKTGDVTVTPKKPDGSTYPPGTKVEIPGKDGNPITVTIGEDGKGKVPNSELPEGKVPGTAKITEPGQPAVEVPVETPAKVTPETPVTEKPGKIEITQQPNGNAIVTPKKPDGSTYPPGTKVEIPGEDGTTITVTIGDNGSGEVPNDNLPKKDVPGTGTVTEPNKKPSQPVDVTTPARKTPTLDVEQDPKTGDVTVTPKKPDGSTYPPGTKVEIPGKDGNPITVTIGEDGKGKVPNSELPEGKVPGTGKITEPGQPAVEVPVETPAKVTPETPVTEKPGKIEITQQPNGNAIVTPKKPDGSTYPPGTKVEIPGEDGITITVTIGDNGSGEVPNDNLPKKDVPGTGTVTEPNKKPSQPVDVTTPARKTPTLDVEQDPKTGDVTVTPKKPDGSTYPPGTKVEIPGKDGNPITVTIGEDGKGKVPNSELPEGKVPGTGKITEPGQPAVEVPVETPAKVTPETPVTEKPGKIEITQQPNGNAIVTPKKPDGSTYPPGTKVEIPGEDGITITVTIGDNGSGEVPNDNLPKKDVPGAGTVTEPNKKPSQPVDVTTPARKTPTLDVEQDPKTGDVTVTPKKPDGSTYPPGTKVEIPGKDGNPITVTIGEDGKGKVPNSELPEGKVPGTGKITEPGQPAVEVPVETPAKVTPETPVTEKPGKIEITQQPNGNAIVTPKKPDGSTYPPRTKVEIPGEDGTTITVTIGDNGSGEVPNDNLPKKDVPGTGTVTEPNKKPSQPVDVTTPARKTPTLDVEQDPKTGDVTVTPKKPDGSTYPPGTKVEIPGKDGNPITVTIGEDGKGKVPNSELPEGKVPGTGKITEPGQPAVEVPVETPAKVTPETPVTEKPVAPVTPDTPVKPDTNGGSGQDTPAPATPTPNAVTPNADQVDTKTTVDNGAKSNDSQNVLPNTGTESNATLASLGLLGMLGGLGLALGKKKED